MMQKLSFVMHMTLNTEVAKSWRFLKADLSEFQPSFSITSTSKGCMPALNKIGGRQPLVYDKAIIRFA